MTSPRIGALEVTVVSDGLLTLAPERMFGPAQHSEWRDQRRTCRHPESRACQPRAGGR